MYNSNDLNAKLMSTIRQTYPNFATWRMIVAGPSGCGKSTLLASFPVPTGKERMILDNEDSMAFLDAGPDGHDVYTPRKQRFAMRRIAYPTIRDYAAVYKEMDGGKSKIGVLAIDNITIFQDLILDVLRKGAGQPAQLKALFKEFGIVNGLPHDKVVEKWAYQTDAGYWTAAKAIPKALIMAAMRNGIHIIASTEEGNVWENYGSANQKVVGKKAKIWDIWMKYFDSVIMLRRDVNSTKPPHGEVNPLQPKMRLQGFNPRFSMDWEGFVVELDAALKRDEPEIPEDAKVVIKDTFEETE